MTIQERIVLLKPLVKLEKDEFVFVQIFQRRKDVPELELSVKRLKSYSFYSWEELESQIPRIQEICDLNNARAYIRLNKQNSIDVSLRCIQEMTENIRNQNSHKNKGVWDSVSGKIGSKDWWVLDFDAEHFGVKIKQYFEHDGQVEKEIYQFLWMDLKTYFYNRNSSESYDETDLKFPIIPNPTKSGIHLIVKLFDTRILEKYNKELSSKGISTIQIQKDANTILYIGNGK